MVDITLADLSVLGPLFQFVNAHRTSGKTAWVVSTPLAAAVLKALYEDKDWLTEWGTFMEPTEAIAWLRS